MNKLNTQQVICETLTLPDGTPLYYESRGQGPTIVLVYGIACLMNHWHHQINYLSQFCRVVTYDLRGHHKSYPAHGTLTLDKLAHDLEFLIDHLGTEPVHVAGHSFGVSVIIKACEIFPQKFKSITLVNGFSKNPIKGMFGIQNLDQLYFIIRKIYEFEPELWEILWERAINNPLAMFLSGLAGGFNLSLTQLKDIEIYSKGVANMDLRVFLDFFAELMKYDGDACLQKTEIPALIIAGEKDAVTPASFQQRMHVLLKNSQLLVVPYGSHCTQLDFPEFVNLALEKFILTHST